MGTWQILRALVVYFEKYTSQMCGKRTLVWHTLPYTIQYTSGQCRKEGCAAGVTHLATSHNPAVDGCH